MSSTARDDTAELAQSIQTLRDEANRQISMLTAEDRERVRDFVDHLAEDETPTVPLQSNGTEPTD